MLVGRVYAETPVALGLFLVGAFGLDAIAMLATRVRPVRAGVTWIAAQAVLMLAPVAVAVMLTIWVYLPRAAGS
jgi:hypothetical protein